MRSLEKIAAAFFDVDGTLFDLKAERVHRSTIEAVNRLRSSGVKIAIASARPLSTMLDIPGLFQIQWDGIVCSNGQELWKNTNKKLIDHTLSMETLDAVFAVSQENDFPVYTAGPKGAFYTFHNHLVDAFNEHYHLGTPVFKSYEQEKNSLITVLHDKEVDILPYYSHIKNIQLIKAGDTSMDIFKKGIDKSTGCLEMLEIWNKKNRPHLCFGDSFGDISMLKQATIGVAMAHSSQEVIDAADMTCSSIEEYLLDEGYLS